MAPRKTNTRKTSAKAGRETFQAQQDDVRQNFWRTAKRAARQIPFMDEVVAAYYCALDKETPVRTKGILFGALAYFVLPTDLVPDFLVGLGFTDDLAVLTAAVAAVRGDITSAHRKAAQKALQES